MSLNLFTKRDFILALTGYISQVNASSKETQQLNIVTQLRDINGAPNGFKTFRDLQLVLGISTFDLTEALLALTDAQIVQVTDGGGINVTSNNIELNRKAYAMERMEGSKAKLDPVFRGDLLKAKVKPEEKKAPPMPSAPSIGQVEVKETVANAHGSESQGSTCITFDFDRPFNCEHPPHLRFINAITNYKDCLRPSNPEEELQLEIMRTILFDFHVNQPFEGGGQLTIMDLAEQVLPHRGPSKIRDAVNALVAAGFLVKMGEESHRLFGVSSRLLTALKRQGYKSSYTLYASTYLGRPNLVNPSHSHSSLLTNISRGIYNDTTMSFLGHLYEHGITELSINLDEVSRQEAMQSYQNMVALEQYGYIKIESTSKSSGQFPIVTKMSCRMTEEMVRRIKKQKLLINGQ